MYKSRIVVLLTIALVLAFTMPAFAKDQTLTVKIDQMVAKNDTNGRLYVRFICPVNKVRDGVEYTDSLPFMAFGNLVPAARKYKEGDTISVVAKERWYEGRQSFTILKFLEQPAQAKKQ
jgi:hypothetical protein